MSKDFNGNVVTINVIDAHGNYAIYTVQRYESRGCEPDWRKLPDENEIKQ